MARLKRLGTALIPDGTALPVLTGPLKGRRWLAGAALGPGKGLSVLLDRCEPGQLRAALRLCPAGAVCFDIGAHAGMYSLLFSRRAGLVYAFEPLPRNLAWLVRTLEANRIRNVRVIPWALGSGTGPVSFREGTHSSEGRLDPEGETPVFAMACDEFCERYGARPALLKIDVEGGELEVLRGAARLLAADKPAILLSTHGDAVKEACFRYLEGLGYARGLPLDSPDPAEAREFSFTP